MGRKDTCEKEFVANDEIFADVVNGVVFSGKQIVKPDDLKELDTTEVYADEIDGIKLDAQKYRDVLKYATIKTTESCCYMIVGVENQTSIHYAMVARAMLYDALNYRSQIAAIAKKHNEGNGKKSMEDCFSGIRKNDKLVPVVTIVIYWGTKAWDAPRSMHELFPDDTPKEVLDLVPNYTIPVLSPAEARDLSIYKTDLKYVFMALAAGNSKRRLKKLFASEPGFSSLDRTAAIVINETTKMGIQFPDDRKEIDMCQAVKEWKEELLTEGIAEGKAQGIAEGKAQGIAEGKAAGKTEGESKLAALITAMSANGDAENIAKVAADPSFREEMYTKYGIE